MKPIMKLMPDPFPLEQLQGHFEIPGVVEFLPGRNDLPRARVRTDQAEAEIYLHGAHITRYQPARHKPVLFMSERSLFAPGKPIRGGVPVIFPWFGLRQNDPDAPLHGIVRLMDWGIAAVEQQPDGDIAITFALTAGEQTRSVFDGDFVLQYTVTIGRRLGMSLRISNNGQAPFRFEEALHTYFQVGDIRQVRLEGLENAEYYDKTLDFQCLRQGSEPIAFSGETDRLYFNTRSTCILHDPGFGRDIVIAKENSGNTVVWNPWIDNARKMPDFGDDEWKRMLCVETCNAREHAIELAPGQHHVMSAVIEAVAR